MENPALFDLKKFNHILIAGKTDGEKSIGINGIILSLLYRNSPDTLKFILINSSRG